MLQSAFTCVSNDMLKAVLDCLMKLTIALVSCSWLSVSWVGTLGLVLRNPRVATHENCSFERPVQHHGVRMHGLWVSYLPDDEERKQSYILCIIIARLPVLAGHM